MSDDDASQSTRSVQEGLILLLLSLDAGLFVALFPQTQTTIELILGVAASLGTGLTLGFTRVRAVLLAAAQRRAAAVASLVALVVLGGAHGVRLLPLVPYSADPESALTYLDGQLQEQAQRRMTLRDHDVQVRGWAAWSKTQEGQVRVGHGQALFALLRIGEPLTARLLCKASIEMLPTYGRVGVEITRCGTTAGECVAVDFENDYLNQLKRELDSSEPGVVESKQLSLVGMTLIQLPIPVGRYRVELAKDGCAPVSKPWHLEAPDCVDMLFIEALECE